MVAIKKCRPSWATMAAALCLGTQFVNAIDLDLSSQDSIKDAASSVAQGMMASYHGNEDGEVPGLLPDPYFWWEGGAMLGAMIDYWHYTGDSSYNDVVKEGLLFQAGTEDEGAAFMPRNQTRSLGNSDQAIWGMAALSAAETSFPSPPQGQRQWLELAKSVFDSMAMRWDEEAGKTSCGGGGLRWQLFKFNKGYSYKDNISNGGFFNLASRLARFTGNNTYANYAGKVWDWSNKVGLIDDFHVYDGADMAANCSQVTELQWSLSHSLYLSGAASMYNSTNGGDKWKGRVDGLLKASNVFFKDDVLTEVACEKIDACDTDMKPFKSYLARGMVATVQMAPYTKENIMKQLRATAKAVAEVCVDSGKGDDAMTICPHSWNKKAEKKPKNDVGSQMSALQAIQANLVDQASAPSNTPAGADGTTDSSDSGSPTSSASGSASSTGAASQLNAQQVLLASPVLSLIFGYFL